MIRVFMVLLCTVSLQAEILEVKQLFNKKIVTVKSVQKAKQKTFYATTRYDESKIVDVTLRFSGFVEKMYADKTFLSVNQGDRLFTIYSDALSQIKAEIDLARQMRQKSVLKNLQKKLHLLKIGDTISRDYTVDVMAPISGIILKKNVNNGAYLKKGMLAYQIVDNRQMWVLMQVYQKDIDFIKKGMDATIMIEGLAPLRATVDFIYPYMDEKSKKIDVRLLVNNPKGNIYPNLFAKVFLKDTKAPMLTLPKSAVLTKGVKHFVFKPLDDGAFEPVEVVAQRIDAHTYEIIKGLKAGDKVIDHTLFMLDADALTNGLYDNDDDEDW